MYQWAINLPMNFYLPDGFLIYQWILNLPMDF